MTLKVGDKLPQGSFTKMGQSGPEAVSTDALFSGKKVVLFAVPGAFTPACNDTHLPGFVVHCDAIKAQGIDAIACMAVNDVFVMDAWGQAKNAEHLMMVGDGNGAFTGAMGLEMDGSGFGMGSRSQRYAMIVEDGTVKKLAVEAPGKLEVSAAEAILESL